MAFDFFNRAQKADAPAERLPPGQYLTQGWPVLHYGAEPQPRGRSAVGPQVNGRLVRKDADMRLGKG